MPRPAPPHPQANVPQGPCTFVAGYRAGNAPVERPRTGPHSWPHNPSSIAPGPETCPGSPTAESATSAVSAPVDTDWHIVTPPADSELPPALRQGHRTPRQRAVPRTRMHASLHAQTRPPAPDSGQSSGMFRSLELHGAAGGRTFDMESTCTPPPARTAGPPASAGAAACTQESLEGSPAGGARPIDTCALDAPQVTPPRLPQRRRGCRSEGHPTAQVAATPRPISRIPRASANKRARRLPAHPAAHAALPADPATAGWASCMRFVLRWLLFAAVFACTVAAACALAIYVLPPAPSTPNAPSAAELRQFASLLRALEGSSGGTAPRQRHGAADVVYTSRGTVAAALEVVSAAEVAQGRLRVSMDQVDAPVPATWEKAAAELEATVSDLKREPCCHLPPSAPA